jgi:hypothetical protein
LQGVELPDEMADYAALIRPTSLARTPRRSNLRYGLVVFSIRLSDDMLAEHAGKVREATFLEDGVVNKKKLRAKWERNAKFNEEQKKRSAALAMEMKLNRAWGGGRTADRMGKKLRPVDRVAKRVTMPKGKRR